MELKELVKKNRSYRGYDESYTVSRGQLEDMIDTARFCPASINRQALKFFLVCDRETNAVIAPQLAWAARLRSVMTLPHEGMFPTAHIVMCHDKNVAEQGGSFTMDAGITAQTILLRAVEMGLGGCMIGAFDREKLRLSLGIADNFAPVLVIAIGKPAETIVLTDVPESGDVGYYRDENDVHYVPKRSLEELLIN